MDIILVGRGGLWHTDDTKQLYIILIKAWKIKDVHSLVRMDEKNVVAIQGPRYIVPRYYCSFSDLEDLMELLHFMFLRFSGTEKEKIGQ